eukprot:5940474-Karenia_brevis.AAC.1
MGSSVVLPMPSREIQSCLPPAQHLVQPPLPLAVKEYCVLEHMVQLDNVHQQVAYQDLELQPNLVER